MSETGRIGSSWQNWTRGPGRQHMCHSSLKCFSAHWCLHYFFVIALQNAWMQRKSCLYSTVNTKIHPSIHPFHPDLLIRIVVAAAKGGTTEVYSSHILHVLPQITWCSQASRNIWWRCLVHFNWLVLPCFSHPAKDNVNVSFTISKLNPPKNHRIWSPILSINKCL